MPGPWLQYQAAGPWQQYQPQPGVAEDMARGAASGAIGGAVQTANGLGDLPQSVQGAAAAGYKFGQGILGQKDDGSAARFGKTAGDVSASVLNLLGISPHAMMTNPGRLAPQRVVQAVIQGSPNQAFADVAARSPSSAQIAAHVPGGAYQPKTVPGQYARTVGAFLPAAVLGSGSIPQRLVQAVAPALASETAGQVTKGTPFEGPARFAAGVAAGALTAPRPAPDVAMEDAQPALAAPQPADPLEALQAAKGAAYQAADQAGVQYTPEAFGNLVSGIEDDAEAGRLNPARHPKAASMMGELQGLREQGYSPTLTELDQLRQVVRRDVASAPDDAERFFGQKMINQIDGFVDGAGPQDVIAGNADDAANLIGRARQLNTQFKKLDGLDDALGRGERRAAVTGSGGNVDNATRQKVLGWYEKNKAFLSPEEDSAAQSVIRGGTAQNLLRLVGKLSPAGNGLMASLDLGSTVLGSLGGPPGAALGAAPGVAGLLAKGAADAMTRGNVNRLRTSIYGGAGLPPPPPRPPMVSLPPQMGTRALQPSVLLPAWLGAQQARSAQ